MSDAKKTETRPASVATVRAVQDAMRCSYRPVSNAWATGPMWDMCETHMGAWGERGCPDAVAAADAAVKVARPLIAAQVRRSKHCGCLYCCGSTAPESRGEGHAKCRM